MILNIFKRARRMPTPDELMQDREFFDKTVYTAPDVALQELRERRADPKLESGVNASLSNDIPEPLKEGPKAVIFRQLVTPNYEIRRFFSIADAMEGLEPLFWEYYDDKFTSNNEWKHSLGKLSFYNGKGKKGGSKVDTLKIIDFNTSNGKKISEVSTLWGQSLVDFHHEFFNERFRTHKGTCYDATAWFSRNGSTAQSYYEHFLTLFVRHGILFENFVLDDPIEAAFTKEIFLPAFLKVWKKIGNKPLIVSLEPTDIEGDKFWICHPGEHKDFIVQKLGVEAAL